jgi:hypothetical protein
VLAGVGVLLALALVGVGLLAVGGLLLEAARRRAALAAELRFTASVGDLRTVILLRRQLASERPRRRPWLRIGSAGARPIQRRGWQSFLRWPAVRIARVLVLAPAAGALAVAAWTASPLLFVLPGVLLMIAALDLIEPLAQEADHPTRFESLPVETAGLFREHLVVPGVALAAVLLLATLAATAIARSALALEVGATLALPTAFVLACCAAFSATNDPFAYINASPGLGQGIAAAPLLLAAFAVAVPLAAARSSWLHGHGPLSGILFFEVLSVSAAWIGLRFLARRMAKRSGVPG